MKRFLTLVFISIFAIALGAGFVACKKDKPADEAAVEQPAADQPAGEEKKEEPAK